MVGISQVDHEKENMFNMVLPSNASNGVFPNNTNSTYRVRLEQAYKFDANEYEVALTEISFPSRWNNITEGVIMIKKSGEEIHKYIRTGEYSSFGDVIGEMERVVRGVDGIIRFVYDKIADIFYVLIENRSVSISFSRDLAEVMGFDHGTYYHLPSNKSVRSPDLDRGLSSMFIYSDLVNPWDIGDTRAQLLRFIKVKANGKNRIAGHAEFKNLQYIPVRAFHGDVVEVFIRHDDGGIIPFEGGRVILSLHFRRIKYSDQNL